MTSQTSAAGAAVATRLSQALKNISILLAKISLSSFLVHDSC